MKRCGIPFPSFIATARVEAVSCYGSQTLAAPCFDSPQPSLLPSFLPYSLTGLALSSSIGPLPLRQISRSPNADRPLRPTSEETRGHVTHVCGDRQATSGEHEAEQRRVTDCGWMDGWGLGDACYVIDRLDSFRRTLVFAGLAGAVRPPRCP